MNNYPRMVLIDEMTPKYTMILHSRMFNGRIRHGRRLYGRRMVGVTWPHNFVKVSISDTRLALNEQLSTSINM